MNDQIPNAIKSAADVGMNYGVALTFVEGLIILSLALISGLFFRFIFWRYSNSFSSRDGFGNTILLVTISVAALIAVVKSSLALSLGLVGALSVVRFRTAVKEPYNLSFILLSVCMGIALGAGQFLFALLVTIFGTMSIMYAYRDSIESNRTILNSTPIDTLSVLLNDKVSLSDLYTILDKNTLAYSIRSINSITDSQLSVVLSISFRSHIDLDLLIKLIRSNDNFSNVSFYSAPTT